MMASSECFRYSYFQLQLQLQLKLTDLIYSLNGHFRYRYR